MHRTVLIGFVLLFFCPFIINANDLERMKIAVASCGKTAKASVSNEAAKCPYYLIFDSNGEVVELIDNPNRDTNRGAGPSAAEFLAQKGITIVIAGNFGSKMINTLDNKGVTHFEFKGLVYDAVKKVLK